MKIELSQQQKTLINLLFITTDLQDDILIQLKSCREFKQEEKQRFNFAKNAILKYVNMVKELNEDIIDDFDHDKNLLFALITLENKATELCKSKEFLNYIENFFN